MIDIFGVEILLESVVLGAIQGMTYGIMAVGLVLIYRSNRIINFAHGQIGAFAAGVFGALVTRGELHYWIAFPIAIALGAGLSAGAEVGIVRRLKGAPRLMSAVATLALAEVLVFMTLVVNVGLSAGFRYPMPRWFPRFLVGEGLLLHEAYFGMLVLTPVIVAGLAIFLRRSRHGLGIRASAANEDAARLSAVFSGRMSSLSWAIAGGVSAFTAILTFPSRSFVDAEALGPSLLLRALAAAVIARMESLPLALTGGLGIGILEGVLLFNYPNGGPVSGALFIIILLVLLFQKRQGGRDEDKSSWAAVQPWPPLRDEIARLRGVQNLNQNVGFAVAALAIALPIFLPNFIAVHLATIVAFALVGLSLGIVTGLGGQLSLGQFAIAGVGAMVAVYGANEWSLPFFLSLPLGGLAGALTSVGIGIPALRIKGLMLTVATLGFALAAQDWIFKEILGGGVRTGRPALYGIEFDTGRRYYWFALAVGAFGLWLTRNVWRSGLGRRMRAVRDNEDGARAFTIPATRVKLEAFAIAGFIAGLGGGVYAFLLSSISSSVFIIDASIEIAILTVLGGVAVMSGPVIGAVFVIGVPLLPLDNAILASSAIGILLVILYFPGGIASLFRPIRDRLVGRVAEHAGLSVEDPADEEPEATDYGLPRLERHHDVPAGTTLLEARDVARHFGGIKAVDGVSFDVRAGETVGLIGPNGAGKTTLFEVIGGFTPPTAGTVTFRGEDVTELRPELRAERGLIRSFQDAALFPTLTTLEVVKLSLERLDPTQFGSSLVGMTVAENRKQRQANDFVDAMGLHAYRNKQIRELSTGTRRITELACLVALEPTLLLLDEPTSGIAQRETEALGELLERIKDDLGLTLLIIEHDIPMVMSISDRVIAMDLGKVIADGAPDAVRNDPAVVASYLGGDLATIERSGTRSASEDDDGRCRATTRAGTRCTRSALDNGHCGQHQKLAVVG